MVPNGYISQSTHTAPKLHGHACAIGYFYSFCQQVTIFVQNAEIKFCSISKHDCIFFLYSYSPFFKFILSKRKECLGDVFVESATRLCYYFYFAKRGYLSKKSLMMSCSSGHSGGAKYAM